MFAKVHGTRDYVKGNSKSCHDLVQYLNKENQGKQLLNKEFFFNQHSQNITDSKVVQVIDNNHKGLKSKDAKFYMLSISPSERELKHLAYLASGRKVGNISELTSGELTHYNNLFKEYVNKVMDQYAASFNRDLIKDNLHYFAKLEQERKYKGTDKEVRSGQIKTGELKPGLQTHAHIVVSRMDTEQKTSLSPHSKSRGHSDKHMLNGKSTQQGFDHVAFKTNCENVFDRTFGFQRNLSEGVYKYIFDKNPNLKKAYDVLYVTESVLNPQKGLQKIFDKTAGQSKTINEISKTSKISQTILRPKSIPSIIIGKVASTNPVTAVALKTLKVIKSVKRIIDPGIDI
jgi:hypothetical protein